MNDIITAILIGAGDRGAQVYGNYALRFPDKLRFIAVAEPNEQRRNSFMLKHSIKKNFCFDSWQDILKQEKLAQIAVITTQDKMHYEPAKLAMLKGYDVLLEKPMSITAEECKDLVRISKETNRILQICHVLRYTNFFSKIKNLINDDKIGKIANISLRENVSSFHYAHSYIRGNWHNRKSSSPMILAKSCHDMDILFWITESNAQKISSFGSQIYFGRKNQPSNAPDRCLDNCPESNSCLYFAPRIYLDIEPLLQASSKGGTLFEKFMSKTVLKNPNLKNLKIFHKIKDYNGWPVNVITNDLSSEGKLKALKETNYGKCVYAIDDHDIVDHQIVSIEFENKITASFTMHGFSHEEGRTIRVDGTKGTIIGDFLISGEQIILYDAYSGKQTLIHKAGMKEGHGGGDDELLNVFLRDVKNQNKNTLSNASKALESHLMAFAADIARLESRVVNMDELR